MTDLIYYLVSSTTLPGWLVILFTILALFCIRMLQRKMLFYRNQWVEATNQLIEARAERESAIENMYAWMEVAMRARERFSALQEKPKVDAAPIIMVVTPNESALRAIAGEAFYPPHTVRGIDS